MKRPKIKLAPNGNFWKRVQVREALFVFTGINDWINHAQGMFRAHGHISETVLCVDLAGKVCTRGLHFETARYPVTVYSIDDPPYEPCGMIGPRRAAKRKATI